MPLEGPSQVHRAPAPLLPVRVAGVTIAGRRVANEDAIYHEVRPPRPGCVRAALAVADGESDEASGALASEIVLRKFRAGAAHAAQDPDIEPSRLLVHLCGRSHEAIRAACEKQRATGNPRASFVGAYIVDNSLVLARAGNALAFLLRNGLIQAIGTQARDAEDAPPADGARPVTEPEPEPALIGGDRVPDVSVFPGEDSVCPLRDGDVVILCS
ncbi:MAG TPA: PP2C family serine/threonine-protein phosphatase, partial [Armatimonadota bacterium]|nr:PP2C family serine/threonine-protein phosphatase [Armatimonadota bacterium]